MSELEKAREEFRLFMLHGWAGITLGEIAAEAHRLYTAAAVRMVAEALEPWEFMAKCVHRVLDDSGIPKPPENEPGIPWRICRMLESIEQEKLQAVAAERQRVAEVLRECFKKQPCYLNVFQDLATRLGLDLDP